MPHPFDRWLILAETDPPELRLRLLTERNGARVGMIDELGRMVADHLLGADVLERLGFDRAAAVVRGHLPTKKHLRSGDLAEIVATEYVTWQTEFRILLKRLRYKDDRDLPMPGDDIVGVHRQPEATRVLKAEVKSRANLQDSVVADACTMLQKYDSRPKPSTLAFIARVLRREGRDSEAEEVEQLQVSEIRYDRVTHMVFTMSGNDPEPVLRPHAGGRRPIDDRRLVGLRIDDHQAFITSVFDFLDGRDA